MTHHGKQDLARTEKIVELAKAGLSLQQVADFYEVSRERIRQIVTSAGVPKHERGIAVRARK